MQGAKELVELLKSKGMKCSFAESLTGGLIASSIVDIPGASEVFDGSIVSYTDEVKINVLGVSKEIIDECTAASSECAELMALGALKLTGADVVVSVTGVAGPGAYYGKPAGTVYFGIAGADGVKSLLLNFNGDRDEVRRLTAVNAIRLATEYVNEH